MATAPGRTLAHYRLVERIGEGGMGEVWKALDQKLQREVAVKLLPAAIAEDPEKLARFEREAKLAAGLNHPTIVTLHSIEEAEGTPFITMELVDGETLGARLKRGKLTFGEILDLAIALADALAAAHDRGITHRDLKPANVMISKSGRIKLLDFGVAKLGKHGALRPDLAAPLTEDGLVMGTVPYMSPEQVRGQEVDHRSDIFSLGTLLYEAATGVHPFQSDTSAELISTILRDDPVPADTIRPELPPRLSRILARCLAKDPARRFPSALDLRRQLQEMELAKYSGAVAAHSGAVPTAASSIAVLPFTDMSPRKDQEYFCDGLAEDIINSLCKIPELSVAARTSAFSFKGKEIDIREIGRQLGVETILEGSVQKAGQRLRITAQLVKVADGYRLWSERYDRQMDDVFAIQDEISVALVEKLRLKLLGSRQPVKRHTESAAAYELYLRGRFDWYRRTEAMVKRGIEFFRQAIEIDPTYALAYVGLADAYNILGFYSYMAPKEAFPRAKAAALKALEMDDLLAEAHVSLGYAVHYYDWDPVAAEAHYRRALELNPDYSLAYHWYCNALVSLGRMDEALAQCRRALEIDPLSSLGNLLEGWIYIFMRECDRAVAKLHETQAMDPDFAVARLWCGEAYLQQGLADEAIAEIEQAALHHGPPALVDALLAQAHASAGRADEARRLVEGLHRHAYIPQFHVALVHLALGETDLAFEHLDLACEARSNRLALLAVEPRLDPLRPDPRFDELVRRVGLSRYAEEPTREAT